MVGRWLQRAPWLLSCLSNSLGTWEEVEGVGKVPEPVPITEQGHGQGHTTVGMLAHRLGHGAGAGKCMSCFLGCLLVRQVRVWET